MLLHRPARCRKWFLRGWHLASVPKHACSAHAVQQPSKVRGGSNCLLLQCQAPGNRSHGMCPHHSTARGTQSISNLCDSTIQRNRWLTFMVSPSLVYLIPSMPMFPSNSPTRSKTNSCKYGWTAGCAMALTWCLLTAIRGSNAVRLQFSPVIDLTRRTVRPVHWDIDGHIAPTSMNVVAAVADVGPTGGAFQQPQAQAPAPPPCSAPRPVRGGVPIAAVVIATAAISCLRMSVRRCAVPSSRPIISGLLEDGPVDVAVASASGKLTSTYYSDHNTYGHPERLLLCAVVLRLCW